MPFHYIHTLDEDALLFKVHSDYLATDPFVFPDTTRTVSPLLILLGIALQLLQNFGCQRHDAVELTLTQLSRHWAKDAGTTRIAIVGDDHAGIVVELDI